MVENGEFDDAFMFFINAVFVDIIEIFDPLYSEDGLLQV